jgi:hypothetical protein
MESGLEDIKCELQINRIYGIDELSMKRFIALRHLFLFLVSYFCVPGGEGN